MPVFTLVSGYQAWRTVSESNRVQELCRLIAGRLRHCPKGGRRGIRTPARVNVYGLANRYITSLSPYRGGG